MQRQGQCHAPAKVRTHLGAPQAGRRPACKGVLLDCQSHMMILLAALYPSGSAGHAPVPPYFLGATTSYWCGFAAALIFL
jgi:hypothetical protein